MGLIASLFAPLQAAVDQKNRTDGFDATHPWHHRLIVNESEGCFDVEYCGEYELWLEDDTTVKILDNLLSALASTEACSRLRSFTYRTAAVLAANGTYPIIIDALFKEEQGFPRLTRFVIDQGEGEHGYKILASARNGGDGYYEEAGVLADLVARMPALQELVTPSPPSIEFFEGEKHTLRSLNVDAGFGHTNFIRNLASSSRFENLRHLVFTDFRQDYLDDWREQATSFEDYVALFMSPVANRLDSICLREVSLDREQVHQLLEIRCDGVEITSAQ